MRGPETSFRRVQVSLKQAQRFTVKASVYRRIREGFTVKGPVYDRLNRTRSVHFRRFTEKRVVYS